MSSVGTTHIAKRALAIWLKFSDDPFGCSSQKQPEEDINPLVKLTLLQFELTVKLSA